MPTSKPSPLTTAPGRPPLLVRLLRARRLPPSAQILLAAVAVVIAVANTLSPAPSASIERGPGLDTPLPVSIRGWHGRVLPLPDRPREETAPGTIDHVTDLEKERAVRSTSRDQVDSWGCKTGCGAAW